MKKNLTKKNYKFKKQSIKVNDIVQIICGNDKTKQGKVKAVLKEEQKIVVEGINWDSVSETNIENKILDKEWDETKEKYNEDSLFRNKRVLSVINNIIDAKNLNIKYITIWG